MATNNKSFYSPRNEGTRDRRQAPPHFYSAAPIDLNVIIQHFTEDLEITKELLALARELDKSKNTKAESLRHALTARLSSMLDFYLHELSRYVLTQIFQDNWQISDEYSKLAYDITIPELNEIIYSDKKPVKMFYDFISKKEHYRSYINPNDIRQLLKRLCIPYEKVCSQSGYSVDKCNQILESLKRDRHTVVHQSGRQSHTAKPISITQTDLEDKTNFLEKFVGAIQTTAEQLHKKGWIS